MNEKKESQGIKSLQERISTHVSSKKEQDKLAEIVKLKEKSRLEQAKKDRDAWYKNFEASGKQAANTIWDWHVQFLASELFKDIAASLSEVKSRMVRISRTHECQVPKAWGVLWTERQFLSLDISEKKLFIHNSVKYGKSYQINGVGDLLEHVYPSILIAIAETITSETIWDAMCVPQ